MKIKTDDYGDFYRSNGKWKQYKNYTYEYCDIKNDLNIKNDLKNVRKSVRKPVKLMRLVWED